MDPLDDVTGSIIVNPNAVAILSDGRVVVSSHNSAVLRLQTQTDTDPIGSAPVLSFLSDGQGVRVKWTDFRLEEGYTLERSLDGVSGRTTLVKTDTEKLRQIYDGNLPH